MSSLSNDSMIPPIINQARVLRLAEANAATLRRANLAHSSSVEDVAAAVEEPQLITLPHLATANDVREVVQYLKKRPDGVDISEVAQPIKKRIFYPPKVTAYESWGIVSRKRGRLKLTQLGWEFARSLEPEARSYRLLLRTAPLFNAAIRWMWQQGLDVVTQDELADYWREEFSLALAHAERRRLTGSAVCFFHLCQAAELGTMTIGKRGQPARLRVLRDELQASLQSEIVAPQNGTTATSRETLRVYISCRRRARVIDQIKETLEIVGIRHAMTNNSASNHVQNGNDALEVTRLCHAGVIVITKEDCSKEEAEAGLLASDILNDIGRAFVNYDGRVLLFWDEEISIPDHLQTVRRCRFKDATLTWEAGVEMLKALKDFAANSQSPQNES